MPLATDSLASIVRARLGKYLRGTVYDPNFDPNKHPRHPAGASDGLGGQFAPAGQGTTQPATPATPPVKAKDRTYDLPTPPKEAVVPPPPSMPVGPVPFTGKIGSKAHQSFSALAVFQAELNDAVANKRAPDMNKLRQAKDAAKLAMGNLTTWLIPSRIKAYEAKNGPLPSRNVDTLPPELVGQREHYQRTLNKLLAAQTKIAQGVGTPVWEVGEHQKSLPAMPASQNQPALPVTPNASAFAPWQHSPDPFKDTSKKSLMNAYNAMAVMQREINKAVASGNPLSAAYVAAQETADARLNGLRRLIPGVAGREKSSGNISANWSSAIMKAHLDHYTAILNDLENAAGAGMNPPQLVWRVHEYGQPMKQIPGMPQAGFTQTPPQGLKVKFDEDAAAVSAQTPGTVGPAQTSAHNSGAYTLWGGVPPRHETNLPIGPANPLTKFVPHPNAYVEANLRPDLNHGDAFDMNYDGPTGHVITMYHGANALPFVAKNGLRWGTANNYGQGVYVTRDFRDATGYAGKHLTDSGVLAVEVHTGRTIEYASAEYNRIISTWRSDNPKLARQLASSDEVYRRALLAAGYSSVAVPDLEDGSIIVLDPSRVRIVGAYKTDRSTLKLNFKEGGTFQNASRLTSDQSKIDLVGGVPGQVAAPVPTDPNALGWQVAPPKNSTPVRNAQVDAPASLSMSDEGYATLQGLAKMRSSNSSLKAKFDANIADARQIAETLLPIRVADAETVENMVKSGGLLARDSMSAVSAVLKQTGDPDMAATAAKLDAVAASPLFNPSDKALGITGFAQMAFGPPMVNLKNSGYGGTADFVLVGKRSILSRPGVMGGVTSISAYADGQLGKTPDKAQWDKNVYDGQTFKEVFAQRLAMGMGQPWVNSRGQYEDFKAPQRGFLNSPDEFVKDAPLFTKETPEVYVPKFVDMSEFSHLLISQGATVTVDVDGVVDQGSPMIPAIPATPDIPAVPPTPPTPAVTAPTVTRNNGGTPQVMDAATYVANELKPGGKLYNVAQNRPMVQPEIEVTGARWYDGPQGNMRPTSTGLAYVNGAWEFVITPAIPGTPGKPMIPGRPAVPAVPARPPKVARTQKTMPAVQYFKNLFVKNNIDIDVIETVGTQPPHNQYAGYGSSRSNSPYEDIMYGHQGYGL